MPIVGVLALQGDFREHVVAVKRAMDDPNFPVTLVKTSEDIEPITHLIIPGGESTVMSKLSIVHQPDQTLRDTFIQKYKDGMKVFGICAGVVLISKKIENQSEKRRRLGRPTNGTKHRLTEPPAFIMNQGSWNPISTCKSIAMGRSPSPPSARRWVRGSAPPSP